MSGPLEIVCDDPARFVERLQAAVADVLDGLAITPEQAHEILLWTVLARVPDDADRLRLTHEMKRRAARREGYAA